LVLAVSGSGCCHHAWRTVRERQADCSRGAVRPSVLRVLCEFMFHFVSIRRVGGFCLEEVGRTVAWGGRTVRVAQTVRGARPDRSLFNVL
jgi:hypothetical protein